MISDQPLVSIGVPIYNDGPWLRNALEYLLVQDYKNLEIILADDGSTDGSRETCREYAQRDMRIRLIENRHNLGVLGNHKLVFDVSTGDYFAWSSGHDYLHSAFVNILLKKLLDNPSVVMCCPRSVFVNEDGEVLRTTKGGLDTRGQPPADRFAAMLNHLVSGGTANLFYGLYRQDALARVDLTRQTLGNDVIMLGELSLLGEVTQIDEILYYRLMNRNEVGNQREKRHIDMLMQVEGFNLDALMPYVGMLFGYLDVIDSSRPSKPETQLLHEVMHREKERIRSILSQEAEHFLDIGKSELDRFRNFPFIRAHRARQILEGINKLKQFGYNTNRMKSLGWVSSKILNDWAKTDLGVTDHSPLFTRFGNLLKRVYGKIYTTTIKKLRKQ